MKQHTLDDAEDLNSDMRGMGITGRRVVVEGEVQLAPHKGSFGELC